MLRPLAALTLLLWMFAQSLCFAHCNFGFSHSGFDENAPPRLSQVGCCSKSAGAGPTNEKAPLSAVCLTLKNAIFAGQAFNLASMEPSTVWPFFLVLIDSSISESERAPQRPITIPEKRLSTPQVCLSPTFRSIPPPSFV